MPWLVALLACSLDDEAAAVRQVAGTFGRSIRSVPAGAARAAWTVDTPEGTVGLVVSGRGPRAAREAAGMWAARARTIAVVGTAMSTEVDPTFSLVVDGDPGCLAAAEAAARRQGTAIRRGRVATVSAPVLEDTARTSLRSAGYAAAHGGWEPWAAAAAALGRPAVACLALAPRVGETGGTEGGGEVAGRDATEIVAWVTPEGATRPPWWAALVRRWRPRQWAAVAASRQSVRQTAEVAARIAFETALGATVVAALTTGRRGGAAGD